MNRDDLLESLEDAMNVLGRAHYDCTGLEPARTFIWHARQHIAGQYTELAKDVFEEEIAREDANYDAYIDSKIDEWRETGVKPSMMRRRA